MKKAQRIIAAIVMALILTQSSALTLQAQRTLNVPMLRQLDTNWCWAASALMTGRFLHPFPTRTQQQIVAHIHGDVVNEPANVFQTTTATRFATHNTMGFQGLTRSVSFAQVRNHINVSLPVQALVHRSGAIGHFYVINGFNEPASGAHIFVIDPWDARGHYVSFNNFLNGNWRDTRPWVNTIL